MTLAKIWLIMELVHVLKLLQIPPSGYRVKYLRPQWNIHVFLVRGDIIHDESTLLTLGRGGLFLCYRFFDHYCGDSRQPVHEPLSWSDCQ